MVISFNTAITAHLTFKQRTFEMAEARAGRSLFKCPLLLSVPLRALPLVAFKCPNTQICVLWPLQPYLSVHKCVYFGHFNLTFQCTNVYFGHFNLTFQCTNICTSAVLRPLKVKRSKLNPHHNCQLQPHHLEYSGVLYIHILLLQNVVLELIYYVHSKRTYPL
jgi:hypothetical protein